MFEVEARPSTTEGQGPFAVRAIDTGDRRRINVVREITDDAPLRPELGERFDHCDYSINVTGGDSWPCRCGASRCRGVVTGDCLSLPEALQREYRPYLADWFVCRHDDRLAALAQQLSETPE